MSLTQVITALARWREDESLLVGIPESREVEFKTTAYRFDTDAAKLEYAKDISGMRNAAGGIIVLGVETERSAEAGRDASVRVRPFPPGTADVNQLYALAREWIYPPQRDIEIQEWPRSSDGKMLISIRVPPPSDPGSLALVTGAEADERVIRRHFGIAIRGDASTEFFGPGEVHDWIRRGRLAGEVGGMTREPARSPDAEMESARSVGEEFPTFVLQAWPATTTRLEGIFDEDGVRGYLARPETIRGDGGFSYRWTSFTMPEVLASGGSSYRRPGALLVVQPTGSVTYARTCSWDGMSWAMNKHSSSLLLNPITLAEETIEFCRLYARIIPLMQPRPPQILFRIAILNTNAQPGGIGLSDGLPGRFPLSLRSVTRALTDDVIDSGGPIASSESPEAMAAQALRRLYERFGHGREAVPFLNDHETAFDIDVFREVSSRPS